MEALGRGKRTTGTPSDPRWSRIEPLLAALAAIALAVLVTWPVALHPGSLLVGHPGNDTWNHVWGHWWVGHELGEGRWPLQTPLINHPKGGTLFYIDTVQAVMFVPVTWQYGPVVSYNATVLFGLALAGFGAWLLARRVVGDGLVAGIALVIYGAAPHLLGQTFNGISETVCAGYLPLSLWALLRLLSRPGLGRALVLGTLGGLTMLTSWYYGLLAGLAGLTVLAWRALSQRKVLPWRRLIPAVAVSVGIALLLVAPMLGVFRASLSAEDAVVTRDPDFVWKSLVFHNVTDLAAFFNPSRIPSPDLKALYGEELIIVIYLGWIAILLAATAWAGTRRRRELAPWGLLGLACFLLALGPYLNVGGDYRTLFGYRVPLPFLLFFKAFPLFDRISHPFRFTTGISLALGVSAAIGLRHLLRRARSRTRIATVGGLALAVLLETHVASPARLPVPTSSSAVPSAYQALAQDPVPGAVLDLPLTVPNLERAIYFYYQATHGRPIPWGLNDPMPAPLIDNRFTATLIRIEASRAWSDPPMLPELDLVLSVRRLQREGYRFIVVHERFYPPFKLRRVTRLLDALLGEAQVWPEEGIRVYTLAPIGA